MNKVKKLRKVFFPFVLGGGGSNVNNTKIM